MTLNRPEVLNAFDFRMLRELARAFEDASWDDEIRVVVVTGTGRAFCVGADLRAWGEDLLGNSKEYWKWFGAFKDMHDRLREIGKPTVARVNGIAVGGGNELQMGCDLAVMVDDAFIRHVGLEHGSVPAGGATQWLPIMIGDRRARELILLCDELPAPQAAEWGLINRRRPRCRAGCRRRRVGRQARAQAARDDEVREAAAELVAGHLVARDRRPRARLALALDARRRSAGRGPPLPRPLTILSGRDGARTRHVPAGHVGPGPDVSVQAGLTALTIAPWRPSATSCVKLTSISEKPAAASPASYSPLERAPAIQPV